MIELKILAALSENRVIGNDGRRPWYLPDDARRLEFLTRGHPVIMGRKGLQDLWIKYNGRLPNHRNYIVLSKTREGFGPGIDLARSFDEAVDIATFHLKYSDSDTIYVAGGERTFRAAFSHPNTITMELTHVKGVYDGDTYFPDFDRDEWTETDREFHDEEGYSLATYRRVA